jgi:RNA polymerase sigma-70 factor (ECF subfamily)
VPTLPGSPIETDEIDGEGGEDGGDDLGPRISPADLWRNDRWLGAVVTAVQRGDGNAFETLVVVIGSPVYRFLRLRLGTEEDARDALQETLLSAWLNIRGLRRTESFRSWILTIAARKAALVDGRRPLPVRAMHVEDSETGVDEALHVRLTLDALPPSSRDLLLLRYVVGLSEREAARVLGVRVGTVKSRTARARGRLASLLARRDAD